MFVVDLLEVKEHPRQAGPLEFEDLDGDTVGLLLFIMKSYFTTGRYLIIDSGFCALKGLIQLMKKVFFSFAVINKRRYWPSMVPDKETEGDFGKVEVGEIYDKQVTVDDVIYNLWRMKDPNDVTRIMATGGRLLADDTYKETVRR